VENMIEADRPQVTIKYGACGFECWITNATEFNVHGTVHC